MRAERVRGFALVELLTVVSIISVLAALLFPVLASAKRSALRSACQSNLHQIGLAYSLYANDFDDHCPHAIDRHTRLNSETIPLPHGAVEEIPDMVSVLLPYAGASKETFRCPRDRAPYKATSQEIPFGTYPSYFGFAGSSYGFWPGDYFGLSLGDLASDPKKRICHDQLTHWHSEYAQASLFTDSVNSLFGDGHVRFTPQVILR